MEHRYKQRPLKDHTTKYKNEIKFHKLNLAVWSKTTIIMVIMYLKNNNM